MTETRERIKSSIKDCFMRRVETFSTTHSSSDSRKSILQRICNQLEGHEFKFTRIVNARWNPRFINDCAITNGAPTNGLYDVIHLLQEEPSCSMIIDPFCYMFLDCHWSYDLCFLDFYQIRCVAVTPTAPLKFYSPVQASKKQIIEALLNDSKFTDAVRSASEHGNVTMLMEKNALENKPKMTNTCTQFTTIFRKTYDSQSFHVDILSGRWNSMCCSRSYVEHQTSHNWLRIRDLASMETVEFDFTWGQFLNSVPSLDNLEIHFYDVGQMRSKGTTDQERQELERIKRQYVS